MNKKDLFKELNRLCLELDEKYYINSGGCCYVAACIAEQLELHNIPYTVIHYDLYGCHYAVKVDDRYINRCDYKKKEIIEEISDIDYLFDTYYDNCWNRTYSKKYNSVVKRKIKSLFKRYENRRS